MQARSATGVHSTQPDLSRQRIKRAMDLAFVQPVAVLIYQKVAFLSATDHVVLEWTPFLRQPVNP